MLFPFITDVLSNKIYSLKVIEWNNVQFLNKNNEVIPYMLT